MDPNGWVVGVDIGGTKVAAALIDGTGDIVRRVEEPTPAGADAVLDTVAALVADLAAASPGAPGAVGVGAPGVVDLRDGSIASATDILPGWAGTAVRAGLELRTGLPIAVDNDVRAMARGELAAGAARGLRDVLFLSIGTGIGGALVRDGRLVRGPHATACAFAHLLVPAEGAIRCGCGRVDHLEAVASGPAIAASYAAQAGVPLVPLEVVAGRMRAGDAVARAVLNSAATLLGRAIAGLLAAVDAEAVVVGGGVAQLGSVLLTPLTDALHAEALPSLRGVQVQLAQLATAAPLIGAALLARDLLASAVGPAR
jgi:glucokinase